MITQLIPVTSGEVVFDGVDITKLRGEKLRQQRKQLQMIFQDPYASTGSTHDVGDIIAEAAGQLPDDPRPCEGCARAGVCCAPSG